MIILVIFISILFDPNSTFALEFNCYSASYELLIFDNETVRTSRSDYIKKTASHFTKWLVKCIWLPDFGVSNLENWNKTTKLVSSNWLLNNMIFDNVLFMYFINNVTIILKPHP